MTILFQSLILVACDDGVIADIVVGRMDDNRITDRG